MGSCVLVLKPRQLGIPETVVCSIRMFIYHVQPTIYHNLLIYHVFCAMYYIFYTTYYIPYWEPHVSHVVFWEHSSMRSRHGSSVGSGSSAPSPAAEAGVKLEA